MRTRVSVALSVALTGALVAACASYRAQEPHQRQLTVAPDPVPCADGTAGSCLSITDADGDSWITYVDEIDVTVRRRIEAARVQGNTHRVTHGFWFTPDFGFSAGGAAGFAAPGAALGFAPEGAG